jgi:hypothetical protein
VLVHVGFGIREGYKRITLILVLGKSRESGTYMLLAHPPSQVYVISGLEIHRTVPSSGLYGHLWGLLGGGCRVFAVMGSKGTVLITGMRESFRLSDP